MVLHFFSDITHFDGKFFVTVKDLFLKPGFLSREYINGRRAKYLHPVRMYVFTSAIFFLLFFSLFNIDRAFNTDINFPVPPEERAGYIQILEKKLEKDTANSELKKKLLCAKDTACQVTGKDIAEEQAGDFRISIDDVSYKSVEEYDSIQRNLPADKRDGWLKKRFNKKLIALNKRFKENPDAAAKELGKIVLHRLPYLLFISLPLFALLLKLVYIRRKEFYFIDHGIFTIHVYIFTFLLQIIVFANSKLSNTFHNGFSDFINTILFIGMYFYLYKAMRKFYGQRRFKTILKFLIISLSSFIMMLLLFGIFIFFSAFTF